VRLPGEQFPADEDPVGDEAAKVSGGLGNTASALAATVGGGTGNAAGNVAATVGGGAGNVASGVAAAVGGGAGNAARGESATVGGGAGNVASGEAATVPGGESNSAGGDHSFAAGRRASADHTGAFVWADARDLDFESSAPNQFRVRATGAPFATAVEFATAVDGTGAPTAGVRLLGGSATWDTLSTREAKDHFAPVDGREVLQRLVALRIESWTYQGQPPAIRHMGPMAEDFAAAFGVGADDRHISTVDLDGVALAAIQGLYQVVQGQHAQLAALEARLAALERGSAAGRD
jgi:hypothetical protein